MDTLKPKIVIVTNHPENVRIIRPGQRMIGLPRAGTIIVDDAIDVELTAVQRARFVEWYEKELVPSMFPDGRTHGWKP